MDWLLALFITLATVGIDVREHLCVTTTIYGEAAGETYLGKWAVGQTIVNRVSDKQWPETACAVVQQPRQFAGYRTPRLSNPIDLRAWEESSRVAYHVLNGGAPLLPACSTATHFHETRSRPWWSRRLTQVCQVDNHRFYR
jgi:spore germination cell wall hydrolase CwlJ-like protein